MYDNPLKTHDRCEIDRQVLSLSCEISAVSHSELSSEICRPHVWVYIYISIWVYVCARVLCSVSETWCLRTTMFCRGLGLMFFGFLVFKGLGLYGLRFSSKICYGKNVLRRIGMEIHQTRRTLNHTRPFCADIPVYIYIYMCVCVYLIYSYFHI